MNYKLDHKSVNHPKTFLSVFSKYRKIKITQLHAAKANNNSKMLIIFQHIINTNNTKKITCNVVTRGMKVR